VVSTPSAVAARFDSILNRMNQKNMVPEKTQNSKTIYIASKSHNFIKTLRNDYNRLLQHCCSDLQPIWSLTCPYRIQESNRGLWDAISTVLIELVGQEAP
jgi:hypothetical protein